VRLQGRAVLFALPRKAVAFLTLFTVRRKPWRTGVSLPAGSDEGYSPSTSAAFLKNCCTKKLLSCSAALRLQKLIFVFLRGETFLFTLFILFQSYNQSG
jgi:hypothetical protein